MRKFKHKKTGRIAEQYDKTRYTVTYNHTEITSEFIEDSNDWEEITEDNTCRENYGKKSVNYICHHCGFVGVMTGNYHKCEPKKDYEVLSYKYDNRIFCYYKTTNLGRFYGDGNGGTIDDHSKDVLLTVVIHSIKRLSDGVVFTIGDKIKHVNNALTCILKSFDINIIPGNCIVDYGCAADINQIEHAKKPLFKTEDGVDIYEGDYYYYLQDNGRPTYEKGYGLEKYPPIKNKLINGRFSTKEAAEEYVLMNKPCLSIKELIENGQVQGYQSLELRKLVKSKL